MRRVLALLCIAVMCISAAACGKKDDADGDVSVAVVDMADIRQAVVDALGDNYFPNAPADTEYFEMKFGLTSDMYEDFFAEGPMISTNVDEIAVVRAKEGKTADVEAALNTYLTNKKNDTCQYPMNLGKIQAGEVRSIGNYVCLVLLGGSVDDVIEQGDEAVIKHCQEQNQLAFEAIEATVVQK